MNKYIALAAAVLLGGASHAAYLYWQVDDTDASDIKFSYARVVAEAEGSSTPQIMYITDGQGVTKDGYAMVAEGTRAAINLDQLTTPSSYSFYIELINYNSATMNYDVVGTSKLNAESYTNLVKANYIDVGTTMQLPTATNIWHGGTYSVPEPTSAMLVMMGLGLLALKRKKA